MTTDLETRLERLERMLRYESSRRRAAEAALRDAERNAQRFHALMLQARVALLAKRAKP